MVPVLYFFLKEFLKKFRIKQTDYKKIKNLKERRKHMRRQEKKYSNNERCG